MSGTIFPGAARWYRYVVAHRVEDYLRVGWSIECDLPGHHGCYSILMAWLCDCAMAEPVK